VSTSVSADKLRVEATTREQLQMFEVQIYSSGSNVAPQGSAIASPLTTTETSKHPKQLTVPTPRSVMRQIRMTGGKCN
jgi:RAB protein geranylgeranyltransferase component A